MWLVAELFETLPEAGDLRQAQARVLLRRGAPAVRRRHRGVPRVGRADRAPDPLQGRRRVLRDPDARTTCPASVLGQLGNRVQHALRAFTPDDAKALKAAVSTYPKSDFYDVEELLTQMGIGEAAVTILSRERRADARRPHAPARAARRAWARPTTSTAAAKASPLFAKYGTRDRGRVARARSSRRGIERPRRGRRPGAAPRAQAKAREGARARSGGSTSSATSSARARARRSSSRSCAACSGC